MTKLLLLLLIVALACVHVVRGQYSVYNNFNDWNSHITDESTDAVDSNIGQTFTNPPYTFNGGPNSYSMTSSGSPCVYENGIGGGAIQPCVAGHSLIINCTSGPCTAIGGQWFTTDTSDNTVADTITIVVTDVKNHHYKYSYPSSSDTNTAFGQFAGFITAYPYKTVVVSNANKALLLQTYYMEIGETTARTFGDPHFIGLKGEAYDVQGAPETWFNILSDKDTQINAFFHVFQHQLKNTTNMRDIAVVLPGARQLLANSTGVYVDEVELDAKAQLDLASVAKVVSQSVPKGSKYMSVGASIERLVEINTEAYFIELTHVKFSNDRYWNLNLKLKDQSRVPHGLLGQTAHHVHAKQHKEEGKEGEGEIEGTYVDYEVSSAFASDFKYNKML